MPLVFAAKWVAIGGLGGLLTMGAAFELEGRRATVSPAITSRTATAVLERAASTGGDRPSKERTGATPAEPFSSGLADSSPTPAPTVKENIAPREKSVPLLVSPAPGSPQRPPSVLPSRAAAPEPVATGAAPGSPAAGMPNTASARLGPEQPSLRLNQEVKLIDGAWAAMKQRDHAAALRALAGYESAYPELALHPEVLFLRMAAEEELGRIARARVEAGRIVALYPKSAQATRARELLARQ